MILEGIVTSQDLSGIVNLAPMGSIVDDSMATLRLRPFQTSQTFRNLSAVPSGVFHVVDDVLLLARAAVGLLPETPATFPAEKVSGVVLAQACRWYEFLVDEVDASKERAEITVRVVHAGRLRDFCGFNRAKHAVLEAAILATRINLIPRDEILAEFARLKSPVDKTAGPQEIEAFALLEQFVRNSPRF
jgi:uncharacterized protein